MDSEPLSTPETNCDCTSCQHACEVKPGWFLPGEAERAAALLGLSLQEFFDKHLSVDWFESVPDIFLLAPASSGSDVGGMYHANPKGRCTFFVGGRCSIYEARPFECRAYHHSQEIPNGRHEAVAKAWADEQHQAQVANLYGDEPSSSSYSIFEALMW